MNSSLHGKICGLRVTNNVTTLAAPLPWVGNPYADWSCHLFTADRSQYILMSNTKSLYSCVMYGAGITDDSRFIERVLSTIREFMENDGQAFAYQRFTTRI